ncbi:hypothetical protein Tco_0256312 [Tanacetum coccineum]
MGSNGSHNSGPGLLLVALGCCLGFSWKKFGFKLVFFFFLHSHKVMAAPTIPVSTEENLRDPIDIRMDIIHPEPVVVVAFPTVAVEELTALRFRVDIAEPYNTSLRARIKTTEAIKKIIVTVRDRLVLRLSSKWLQFRSPNVRTERTSGNSRSS